MLKVENSFLFIQDYSRVTYIKINYNKKSFALYVYTKRNMLYYY